jgi:sec-independent protein translocase protein TatB
MFDIGWTEMLVIAVVMIVVVGPKDLPRMLRTFGRTTAKLRSMAGDFQKQFNEALREAELEDVKKSVDELKNLNPASQIKKQLNPFEKAAQDIRAGLDTLKPAPPSTAAAAATTDAAHGAEPLKNGATVLPGVEGPLAMPTEPPVFPVMAAAAAAEAGAPASAGPAEAGPAKTEGDKDAPVAAEAKAAGRGSRAKPKAAAAKGPTAPTKNAKPAKVSPTVAKATAGNLPAKAADDKKAAKKPAAKASKPGEAT